jgi:hypothetical protein
VINPDNSVTYTPDANFNGIDSFNYTMGDGSGDMATALVTVSVTSVNDAPVAVDDSAAMPENGTLTLDVLANDYDVEGDSLTVTAVTTATHGLVVINPDNTVTYTPDVGFAGSDSFGYTISDGNGGSDTAVMTITVTAGNENPIAVDDVVTTPEDTAVVIDVLANDTDVDYDPLTVTSVVTPSHGLAVINPDNTVTYTPDADFYGSDSFNYTVSDGNGGSDTAAITVTVTSVNDVPIANDDTADTLQETAVLIAVLANDADVDGDALTVTAVTTAAHGTVVINPDNSVLYTPDVGFSGTDSFSYTVSDGQGGADTAVVTVMVTPVAGACELYPIAVSDDVLASLEIGDYSGQLQIGRNPGNFGWLTWTGNKSVPTLAASLTPPGNNHTYINPFDPNDHALSIDDWVRGKPGVSNARSVRDALETLKSLDIVVPVWDAAQGGGAHAKYHISDFAVIRLTDYHLPERDKIEFQFLGYTSCVEENNNPIAVDDSIITGNNAPITIDLLANDSDVDGDVLSVLEITQPLSGTAVINPDNTITYTPNASFIGEDTFYYTISDGRGGTHTAAVTIVVTASAGACELYPIAIHEDTLNSLNIGDTVYGLRNGKHASDFGWLSWTGDKGVSSFVDSLSAPGNSFTYENPFDANDHEVSIGDWVWGKPGLSNACILNHALTEIESRDIVVPVWNNAANSCGDLRYQVSSFATIRVLHSQLHGQDKIDIQFLGYTTCAAE